MIPPAAFHDLTADDVIETVLRPFSPLTDLAPVTWVVDPTFYAQFRTMMARQFWKETYRAARVLGNRELAIQRVGNRRNGFEIR